MTMTPHLTPRETPHLHTSTIFPFQVPGIEGYQRLLSHTFPTAIPTPHQRVDKISSFWLKICQTRLAVSRTCEPLVSISEHLQTGSKGYIKEMQHVQIIKLDRYDTLHISISYIPANQPLRESVYLTSFIFQTHLSALLLLSGNHLSRWLRDYIALLRCEWT